MFRLSTYGVLGSSGRQWWSELSNSTAHCQHLNPHHSFHRSDAQPLSVLELQPKDVRHITDNIAALKFCFKTGVMMKFVDDDDDKPWRGKNAEITLYMMTRHSE